MMENNTEQNVEPVNLGSIEAKLEIKDFTEEQQEHLLKLINRAIYKEEEKTSKVTLNYEKEYEWLRKESYKNKVTNETIIDALVFYINNKDKE